ncbi:MAG TPA: hypothetical protein VK502_04545 [Candidatus Saccharimonadales bacterium]|nr:hypothetical protein [Candidatus Saccharimonadales bacterium]
MAAGTTANPNIETTTTSARRRIAAIMFFFTVISNESRFMRKTTHESIQ